MIPARFKIGLEIWKFIRNSKLELDIIVVNSNSLSLALIKPLETLQQNICQRNVMV